MCMCVMFQVVLHHGHGCCCASTQKLNLPALSVTSDSFVPMLARLDECIAFIQSKVCMHSVCVVWYTMKLFVYSYTRAHC